MSRTAISIDATPEEVFAVLADPRSFARWVVGSQAIRRADADWPAPGSAFDHAVGIGPLRLKDHSVVQECDRPRLLRLLVRARPFTTAHVTLRLRREGSGTLIEMEEGAADRRSLFVFNPLTDPLVHLRNHESLRRLKALAERREPVPDGELPRRGSAVEAEVTGDGRPPRSG